MRFKKPQVKTYNELAEETFLKAIEINPSYAEAYYHLSLIYSERQDYKKAEYMINKAIRLYPSDVNLVYNNDIILGKFEAELKPTEVEKQTERFNAHFAC